MLDIKQAFFDTMGRAMSSEEEKDPFGSMFAHVAAMTRAGMAAASAVKGKATASPAGSTMTPAESPTGAVDSGPASKAPIAKKKKNRKRAFTGTDDVCFGGT